MFFHANYSKSTIAQLPMIQGISSRVLVFFREMFEAMKTNRYEAHERCYALGARHVDYKIKVFSIESITIRYIPYLCTHL